MGHKWKGNVHITSRETNNNFKNVCVNTVDIVLKSIATVYLSI